MNDVPAVIDEHLNILLDGLRNRAPGHEYSFFVDRIGVRCWIPNRRLYLAFVLALADVRPQLLDEGTPDKLVDRVIAVIHKNMDRFKIEPFMFGPLVGPATLLDCVTPSGMEQMRAALVAFATHDERALFMLPWMNREPPEDLVAESLVWIRPSVENAVIETTLGISMKWADLRGFPPFRSSSMSAFDRTSSWVGLVGTGWADGIRRLRSLAGAFWAALPDWEALHRTSGEASVVARIAATGQPEARSVGSIMPQLTRPTTMSPDFVTDLRELVVRRADDERETRFRTALSFVAAAWLFTGTTAFANYFIALDSLFGQQRNGMRAIRAAVTARLSASVPDVESKIHALANIRHELLHGRDIDINRTSQFVPYFKRFGQHPLPDLASLVRKCVRAEPRG